MDMVLRASYFYLLGEHPVTRIPWLGGPTLW